MEKVINVIVSGLGRISWQYHLPVISKDRRFRLLAVADPDQERCREALAAYPGIRAYADFEEMCRQEPEAACAVLCSPTLFHRDQAETAMKYGLDVFMEKPMCDTFEAACQVAETAKENACKVLVYQPHRVRPEFLTFQESVRPRLGRIFHARRTFATFNRRNDWQSRVACGGGMLNNYGAHYIDQFLAAFGPGPLKVRGSALQRTVGIGDAEDLVNVILETPGGVLGSIEINLGSAFHCDTWEVFGICGTARWSWTDSEWKIRRVDEGTLPELTLQSGLAAAERRYSLEGSIPWIEESVPLRPVQPECYYDHLYDYFAAGKKSFLPLEESLELIRILAECRKKFNDEK